MTRREENGGERHVTGLHDYLGELETARPLRGVVDATEPGVQDATWSTAA